MDLIFVVLLVVLTSLAAYFVTTKWRSAVRRPMREALRAFFEWIGTFTIFLTANLLLGLLVVFLIRGLTSQFVSLYNLENMLLLILSAAQAFVFQHWWKHAAQDQTS